MRGSPGQTFWILWLYGHGPQGWPWGSRGQRGSIVFVPTAGRQSLGLPLGLSGSAAYLALTELLSQMLMATESVQWPCDVEAALGHSGSTGASRSPGWGAACEVRAVSECSLLFQHKVTFDPTSSYTLEDLKPDTLYHFQLAARSEMGVGVFTPTVEARTAQSSKCLLRLRLL